METLLMKTQFYWIREKMDQKQLCIWTPFTQRKFCKWKPCFVCFKSKTLCICRFFQSSPSSSRLLPNIGEFGTKKYFTDHQTTNAIKLSVALKGNFSGLFFFWTSCSRVEFPKDYLINVATCLFACH